MSESTPPSPPPVPAPPAGSGSPNANAPAAEATALGEGAPDVRSASRSLAAASLGATGLPPLRWLQAGAAGLALLSLAALVLGWSAESRLQSLEQELVRRQQSSQDQSTEARLLARQAHDTASDMAAKLSLLEARVAESALQRSQVEELIQSLSRSRDENVVADLEAALRVAQQQSAITGSAEPMLAVLKQAEDRLARYNQPRLERVRRAVARDLDRVRSVSAVDVPSLSIRLDEAVRLVDDLPLVAVAERRNAAPDPAAVKAASSDAAASGAGPNDAANPWWAPAQALWRRYGGQVWDEFRSLVRVSRIDRPEAMLIAPEQTLFLREHLKLRLLNARLALMSRQFDLVQSDLAQAQAALDRYFDRQSRRVVAASELLRQVASQSRQVVLPRPEESLAALAATAAGR